MPTTDIQLNHASVMILLYSPPTLILMLNAVLYIKSTNGYVYSIGYIQQVHLNLLKFLCVFTVCVPGINRIYKENPHPIGS